MMAEDTNDPVQRTEARFGERVRLRRMERGMSQRVLADWINLDASAISRLEQGTRAVRLGEATLIADALGVELSALTLSSDLNSFNYAFSQQAGADDRMIAGRAAYARMAKAYMNLCQAIETYPNLLAELHAQGLPSGPSVPRSAKEFLARRAEEVKKQGEPVVVLDCDEATLEIFLDIIATTARSAIALTSDDDTEA